MSHSIGQVANAAGVGVETIRFYEREGLLRRPARPTRGHREYPESAVRRVKFIRRAQELGFTLREIQELIALQEAPVTDCAEVCKLAGLKVEEIDTKIADLGRIRTALNDLISACGGRRAVQGCAILDSLEQN